MKMYQLVWSAYLCLVHPAVSESTWIIIIIVILLLSLPPTHKAPLIGQTLYRKWKWSCSVVDCSPPSSSIHGILRARVLEWVAISFSFSFIYKTHTQIQCMCFLRKYYSKIHGIRNSVFPGHYCFLITGR